MRRWWAIARSTLLEVSSEPLALLLTVSAVTVVAFAAVFHIHQFGGADTTRMARDASLSAMLIAGLLLAVFCTIKVFRREFETGTLEMALSHPVSRTGFFLSKALGAFLAYLVFALTLYADAVTMVTGARVGGVIAADTGRLAFIWGPSLAIAAATVVLGLAIPAVLNRFLSFRFTSTATFACLAVALAGMCLNLWMARECGFWAKVADIPGRLAPAAVMLVFPAAAFVAASAAFAVRFRDNAAATLAGVLFVVALPAFGNYYLSSALSKGGAVPWSHVALGFLAAAPFIAGFALVGVLLVNERDVA